MIRVPLTVRLLAATALMSVHSLQALEAQSVDAAQELQAIFADPAVQSALQHVEAEDAETMRTLVTLTEIPAPPFAEGERAAAFRDMLVEALITSLSLK